jgi:thiopeptide-type bacteriocin biosynthesis protein
MHEWISYHFSPLETPDVFLVRAWKPFLEQYIWPRQGARAFFIRYEDEHGAHLRLRLKAEADYIAETLEPAFVGWMVDRGEFQQVAYQPETERFGGPEALALAEEHFHLSTRVVLERLSRAPYTYGDALFDALRMHLILAYAAGLERSKAAWYFSRLSDLWLPSFFRPEGVMSAEQLQKQVKGDFEKHYAGQEEGLQEALLALWTSLEQEKFDPGQPEWLRWLRGNQMILDALGDQMEKVLPSLLHLNGNRLGLNNQDEVYILYVLGRTL